MNFVHKIVNKCLERINIDTFLDKYETVIKLNFIDEVSNKLNTDTELTLYN